VEDVSIHLSTETVVPQLRFKSPVKFKKKTQKSLSLLFKESTMSDEGNDMINQKKKVLGIALASESLFLNPWIKLI